MRQRRLMREEDFEQFHTTLAMWFSLRICNSEQLAAWVGCTAATINRIRRRGSITTYRMANEIMRAIGQIEQRYIKQWRDRRAKCGGAV